MDDFLDKLPEMDLMRSEKMTLVQLIIPVESAHRCVTYLGELGLLQFRDVSVFRSAFFFSLQIDRNPLLFVCLDYLEISGNIERFTM